MKKEITMTLVFVLALIAVSVCFRQVALTPAAGLLNTAFMVALGLLGAALIALFAITVKRLFVRPAN